MFMENRPALPKKLAARIRAAQSKVLNARTSIYATLFNSIQDHARLQEYERNPLAFAEKYYAGHGVDSYPVQVNISRIRNKLSELPNREMLDKRELEMADANLVRVELDVLNEVSRLRQSGGRVPWPAPLESYDSFYDKAIKDAYHQRDTADDQRAAYLAQAQEIFEREMAQIQEESDAELVEFREEIKSWTPQERAKFREVISSIVDGLRNGGLEMSDICDLIDRKFNN